MSRRKPLKLETLRASVLKLSRATREHEMRGAGHPEDIPVIQEEYDEAWSVLDSQLQRVESERAELVAALKDAIARLDAEVHSGYGGTSLLKEQLAEQDDLRTVVAKFEVAA